MYVVYCTSIHTVLNPVQVPCTVLSRWYNICVLYKSLDFTHQMRGEDELCTPSTHISLESPKSQLFIDVWVDMVLTSPVPSNSRQTASGQNQTSIFPRSESRRKSTYRILVPVCDSLYTGLLDDDPTARRCAAARVPGGAVVHDSVLASLRLLVAPTG